MQKFNAEITRSNILRLLEHSGVTLEQFANIIGVSRRWLLYIKSGKYEFDLTSIERASLFFNFSFSDLTTKTVVPKNNLRSVLAKQHKANPEFKKILEDIPSIPYAIQFVLILDKDFASGETFEIKEIRRILNKYNMEYKSSSLSVELRKSPHIISEQSSVKMNTFLYKKRQTS